MKVEPNFEIHDLIRAAVLKRTFSKGDTTNWSDKLYEIVEIINDTIPTCHSGEASNGRASVTH